MNNVDLESCLPTASGTEPDAEWLNLQPPDKPKLAEDQSWLEDALPLAVFTSTCPKIRTLVKDLFDEVSASLSSHNEHRIKEAIKTIVLNLWRAKWMDMPVRYSRKKSYYTRHQRYGQLHFKYRRLVQIIDALYGLGYLQQKQGFFVREKDLGRQTRMWGTDKLWALFEHHHIIGKDFIKIPEPEELIELRTGEKDGGKMDYPETTETLSMRDDLARYNGFVKQHDITVQLDGDVEVSSQFLLKFLEPNIINNTIILDAVVWDSEVSSVPILTPVAYNTSYHNTNTTNTDTISNTLSKYISYYSMTGTRSEVFPYFQLADPHFERLMWMIRQLRRQLRKIDSKEDRIAFLDEKRRLKEFGIEFLIFRLVKEGLHRVFNRGSFDCNGRAYGALHQQIPKDLRPFIYIDGHPTIEIDFSAYHILMLYHLQGIDYPEDPYTACGGPELRKAFKTASLIAINAPSIRKAYRAIIGKFKEKGIPLPKIKKPLKFLVETFKAKHQPIANSICSDAGIKLQNIDSHIMNAILMRLMGMGILGLSVYDSVIVAEEFGETAKAVMIEEYQKVFGFKPRV
jgi:hypothetical protein